MNGGNEKIDKLFKEAFSGDQFPVNEALWAEASTMIKTSAAKPNYLGVVSGIVAIAALIGASAYFFTGENLTAKNHTYTERTAQAETNFLTSSILTDDDSFTHQLFASKNSNSNSANSPHNKSIKTNTPTNTAFSNNQNIGTGNSHNRNSNKSSNTQGLVDSHNSFSTSNSNRAQQLTGATQSSGLTYASIAVSGSEKPNENAAYSFDESKIASNSPNEEFIHLTPRTHAELMNEPLSEINSNKQKTSKPKLFAPFNFRLSAGYGFGSILNSSSLNPNTTYTANQTNFEFSVEYLFNPKWGVQTGVTYNLINEKQNYNGLTIEDNSFFELEDNSYWNYFDKEVILTDQTWWLGDWWVYGTYTDTILDSNYVTQVDSNLIQKFDSTQTEFTENQKITQLEFPVLITYNFVHKRWSFQIATGASFGVFLNSQGKVIRFNNDAVTGFETNKGLFNSLQYNYLLSAEAGFGLNEHWRITARPQLKVNMNSMFNSESGYSQKYLFYGLNIGVAFNF